MKSITYSEKSVMVGNAAADLLMDYAKLLARSDSADTVNLSAIGMDGVTVKATFLIGPASIMMAESSASTLPEPDNSEGEAYMREKIDLIVSPPSAALATSDDVSNFSDDDIASRFE